METLIGVIAHMQSDIITDVRVLSTFYDDIVYNDNGYDPSDLDIFILVTEKIERNLKLLKELKTKEQENKK